MCVCVCVCVGVCVCVCVCVCARLDITIVNFDYVVHIILVEFSVDILLRMVKV